MEEKSGRRDQRGEIMEEKSWRASGRQKHPEGTHEIPKRHPGGPQETPRATLKAPRETQVAARRTERSLR